MDQLSPLESLLNILVCPSCKGDLKQGAGDLTCEKCQLVFPVTDGIPVMLIESATKPL